MSNISLTFVAHQPNRLIHYDFFKIGEHAFYEDDDLNARVLSTVAERCYFPATRLMKQLIELTGGKFRFGLALSGVILEQALYHRPDLIAAFKDLAETGCVDFLAMPYYNSLASVYSPQEFAEQIEEHRELLKKLFHQETDVLMNTGMLYSNAIAAQAETLGRGCITPPPFSATGNSPMTWQSCGLIRNGRNTRFPPPLSRIG